MTPRNFILLSYLMFALPLVGCVLFVFRYDPVIPVIILAVVLRYDIGDFRRSVEHKGYMIGVSLSHQVRIREGILGTGLVAGVRLLAFCAPILLFWGAGRLIGPDEALWSLYFSPALGWVLSSSVNNWWLKRQLVRLFPMPGTDSEAIPRFRVPLGIYVFLILCPCVIVTAVATGPLWVTEQYKNLRAIEQWLDANRPLIDEFREAEDIRFHVSRSTAGDGQIWLTVWHPSRDDVRELKRFIESLDPPRPIRWDLDDPHYSGDIDDYLNGLQEDEGRE